MALLDGLKEILLSTNPIGLNPEVGYIFKWIEKVGLDHIYKGKDSFGNVFDIGTSGTPPIPATWEDNPLNNEGIRPVGNKEVAVGLPEAPREFIAGGGDSYLDINSGLVYTFDGITFTDRTSLVLEEDANKLTFDSVADGNMIFISSKLNNGLDEIIHSGLKLFIDIAASLGTGDIVFEFYNGSSWEEFNHMSTDSMTPFLSHGNEKLETIGTFQYLYNGKINSTWAKNDPMSLGTPYYWIRLRINGTIITSPVIDRIKLHPIGRTEINPSGFITRYGQARAHRKFPMHYGNFSAAGNSPANSDIYLSDNLSVGMTENEFQSGTTDRSGFQIVLPGDISTDSGIDIHFLFFGDTNHPLSDIDFTIRWALFSTSGQMFTGTIAAPPTAIGEKSISSSHTMPLNAQYDIQLISFNLDIAEAIPETALKERDHIMISFERQGAADTYAGDIIMIDVVATYLSWKDGGTL